MRTMHVNRPMHDHQETALPRVPGCEVSALPGRLPCLSKPGGCWQPQPWEVRVRSHVALPPFLPLKSWKLYQSQAVPCMVPASL